MTETTLDRAEDAEGRVPASRGPVARQVSVASEDDVSGTIGAHDLVLVGDASLLRGADGTPLPGWALEALATTVPARPEAAPAGGWAVVRRGPHRPGLVPVGIRGRARSERFAALAPASAVLRVVHPWQIDSGPRPGRAGLPAFAALAHMREALHGVVLHGVVMRWGPGGSVAHELVTGAPAVSPSSDLDLVVDAPSPLPDDVTGALYRAVEAAPARVDAQIVTPAGGFALLEWARPGRRRVALRTASGPMLTDNPWR